tara:strand:- start:477 stop:641 length:165 start_codon:yes stop_codon:yes gene_type:complete
MVIKLKKVTFIKEEMMKEFKVFLDDEAKTVVANDLESVLELLEGHGYIVEKKED